MYLNLGGGKYLNMDRVEEVRIGTSDTGLVAVVTIGGRNQYYRGAEADMLRRWLECDSSVCVPPAAGPAVVYTNVDAVRGVTLTLRRWVGADYWPDHHALTELIDRLDAALANSPAPQAPVDVAEVRSVESKLRGWANDTNADAAMVMRNLANRLDAALAGRAADEVLEGDAG